jgi:teichuronic acid biosynthesis glycosyltransferase TuaC
MLKERTLSTALKVWPMLGDVFLDVRYNFMKLQIHNQVELNPAPVKVAAAPILTISYLFPSEVNPIAGVFIRERIVRVAERWPTYVVSPQPWSPFDFLIRMLRNPKYRLVPKQTVSVDRGVEVHRPQFLSLPMVGRFLDSRMMAWSINAYLKKHLPYKFSLIDAQFVYPDGAAAKLVADKLAIPFFVTLRGERDTGCEGTKKESAVRACILAANHVVSVSDDLRKFAMRMGAVDSKASTIPNGVNLSLFYPEDARQTRVQLGISAEEKVLIAVGSYSNRKGHQRILSAMPKILRQRSNVTLLLVGGPTSTEDNSQQISTLIHDLGLKAKVIECGQQKPESLRQYLCASDLFVLATEHEGRANVMNEAAACGLPIVTTDVGGNSEIVSSPDMGAVVPFWDEDEFCKQVIRYLDDPKSTSHRLEYAKKLTWENTASRVINLFESSINKVNTELGK